MQKKINRLQYCWKSCRERLRDYRSNISALPQHFFKEEADIKLPEYTLPSTVSSDDFRKKFTGVELNKVK